MIAKLGGGVPPVFQQGRLADAGISLQQEQPGPAGNARKKRFDPGHLCLAT